MSGPAHDLAAERTFLHDLSNPLAIGVGNVNLAITSLEEAAKAAAAGAVPISDAQMVLSRCQKAAAALERVVVLIEERRRWLKANVTPAAQPLA